MQTSKAPAPSVATQDAGRSVTGIHNAKGGKVSNKWSSYLPYYDRLFAPLRDRPVRLLEIGIQNGGSLETWAQYFAAAEAFVGCDIDPKCGRLSFDDDRIDIVVGNANSTAIHRDIVGRGPFDIIIDDGSHLSEDILVGFLNYFPVLAPGGLYVVEDTHAVYQRASTNILNTGHAMAFFKDLTDLVNYQFWFRDSSIEARLAPYLSVAIPGFLKEGWIESVEFRNSIVTIRKAAVPNLSPLGEMNIAGDTADVDPEPLRIKRAMALAAA